MERNGEPGTKGYEKGPGKPIHGAERDHGLLEDHCKDGRRTTTSQGLMQVIQSGPLQQC